MDYCLLDKTIEDRTTLTPKDIAMMILELTNRLSVLETLNDQKKTNSVAEESDLPFPQLLENERRRYASIMEENIRLKMEIKGYISASKSDEEELTARSNIIRQKTQLIEELVEEVSYLKEDVARLNDVADLTPLPGSPEYRECLQWLVDNLPQIYKDASLGRQIRNMPVGCSLHKDTDFWQTHQIQKAHEVTVYDLFQSPEDALHAAGVKDMEETFSDDGFPADYSVSIGHIRPKDEV